MARLRPTSDIASFPAPGWTDAGSGSDDLYLSVAGSGPEDATYVEAPAAGLDDPQISFGLGGSDIPYGASGRATIRVRMRWSAALTEAPQLVRAGLANASALTGSEPTLVYSKSVSFTATDFTTVEFVVDFTNFLLDDDGLGVYVEMLPAVADAAARGQISWIEVEIVNPAKIVGQSFPMTLDAAHVIREARDHHPSFEQRAHPDANLLRVLSSIQKQLVAKAARVNPEPVSVQFAASLPLADFNEGILLPAYAYLAPGVLGRYVQSSERVERLEIVPMTMRADRANERRNTVYLQGGRMYLTGVPENWTQFGSIEFTLVPMPKAFSKTSDKLSMPEWAEDAYVGGLVSHMAVRGGLETTALLQMGQQMEQMFLDTLAQQKAAQTSYTRDVFPGGW